MSPDADVDDDAAGIPRPETVATWIEWWLGTMASKIRASTLRDYTNGLRRVVDGLGDLRLEALTPMHVEELYSGLLANGHRYGGPLAPKTVRNVHIALRRSFADAERFGLVERNVAALVKPPVPTRAELTTWTADDMKTFLAAVDGDRNATAYRLLATTGMRRGEALGLHWSYVDLERGRVVVNRSLTVVRNELVWSTPKTARSRRTVALDHRTVQSLRRHQVQQLEERVSAGDDWHDEDLVFCDEVGRALHPDRFTRAFNSAAHRARVPRIRLHDLRHTWATLALQAGIHPKVVSERLGHATTGVTLDIYSHVQPELDAHAASVVAQLFS